jgi:hypothetical protein
MMVAVHDPAGPSSMAAASWAILRCYGPSTQRLAEALRDQDLVAWTPMIRRSVRLPRSKKREWRIEALLPSFVFVEWDHADNAFMKGLAGKVPPSTIFRFNGERVQVSTEELEGLEEAQRKGMMAQVAWAEGTLVEVVSGLAAREQGHIVKKRSGNHYIVQLVPSRIKVIVPGFLLRPVTV